MISAFNSFSVCLLLTIFLDTLILYLERASFCTLAGVGRYRLLNTLRAVSANFRAKMERACEAREPDEINSCEAYVNVSHVELLTGKTYETHFLFRNISTICKLLTYTTLLLMHQNFDL